MKKLAFATAAAALSLTFAPSVSAANLITNGDFSTPNCAGWSVFSNAFSCNGAYQEGAFSSHPGDGVLSQTFGATAGAALSLSFDYSGNSGYQYVRFNGVDVAGSYIANPTGLQTYNFNLGPALASNTIEFRGRNEPSYNYLDNVSITTAVPEPATWALLILGFGATGAAMRRRKQVVRVSFA